MTIIVIRGFLEHNQIFVCSIFQTQNVKVNCCRQLRIKILRLQAPGKPHFPWLSWRRSISIFFKMLLVFYGSSTDLVTAWPDLEKGFHVLENILDLGFISISADFAIQKQLCLFSNRHFGLQHLTLYEDSCRAQYTPNPPKRYRS